MKTKHALIGAVAALLSFGAPVTALAPAASASSARRVDLVPPTFSDPTNITNPLFPINDVEQMVQLGAEGDIALRQEVTLMDRTQVIHWDGRDIEVRVSQFVAYGDGEIIEVAIDYFAQADDGAVWYLGEDVTTYDNGQVESHDGTWRAGVDGPGGMIMPAHPRVGDTYRPENIPGVVFEEVTVLQTGLTVDGPTGPIAGAIEVLEEPMDGALEYKIFAPGYGEFRANVPADEELVDTAIAVPIDAVGSRSPVALDTLSDTAGKLFAGAGDQSWGRLSTLAASAHRSWDRLSTSAVPALLADQAGGALDNLDAAVGERSRDDVKQAAIDLEFATIDLELQYDTVTEVDADRLATWELQLQVHRAGGKLAAVASDRVIIAAISDRLPA